MSESDGSTEFADDNMPLLKPANKRMYKTVLRDMSVFIVITINFTCLLWIIVTVSQRNAELELLIETIKNSKYDQSEIKWPVQIEDLTVTQNLTFYLRHGEFVQQTWHHLFHHEKRLEPEYCTVDYISDLCLEWTDGRKLEISVDTERTHGDGDLNCYKIEWSTSVCDFNTLTDCFDVAHAHWYGGFENRFQYWPFERNNVSMSPYISNDASGYAIGNVLERYFISSNGVGLNIDNDVPLFFSLNNPDNGSMCFSAQYNKYPYFYNKDIDLKLSYRVCHSKSHKDVKNIHKAMSASFLQRPEGIPHKDLFRFPIWSTWAQFHFAINQTIVLNFTKDIVNHGFSCAQIEIDDNWTPHYGDFLFDVRKFPNASSLVAEIKKLCGAVTVWVHPFFNMDGEFFKEAMNKQYLLRQVESSLPALTGWWDGHMAGVLDVSNSNAVSWYLGKLKHLQSETGVDSFKFDAGELSWIPKLYDADDLPLNPDDNYPAKYVKMAAQAVDNNRQEVRSGYRSQKHPVLFRQIDKSSEWGHNNGIESIIPGVFTFGILGYPFVLPDMIGGNAYGRFPDPELFVRWMQLNSFLPSLQFSIVPWDSKLKNPDIDVANISRKFVKLHEEVAEAFIKFAKDSVQTGEPIIRPLWWIDPTNDVALRCEDEYLVGDQYLVAPIVIKGARSRDIFVPSGSWLDMLRGNRTTVVKGPTWLYKYKVNIDELAYFKNVK